MHHAPFCAWAGFSTQTTAATIPRINKESFISSYPLFAEAVVVSMSTVPWVSHRRARFRRARVRTWPTVPANSPDVVQALLECREAAMSKTRGPEIVIGAPCTVLRRRSGLANAGDSRENAQDHERKPHGPPRRMLLAMRVRRLCAKGHLARM